MTDLFSSFTQRGVTFRNRIGIAPMCQYCCADDGLPTDWHLAHLASRAVGGAGMVCAEASAVEAIGRISHGDLGIWSDAHIGPHKRLAAAIAAGGAVPAIQLAHAGRKASRAPAWYPAPATPSWDCAAPSALAFQGFAPPHEMSEAEILETIDAFAVAAKRSVAAGYKMIEMHAAHGYLSHQFLSPLSNQRSDKWGGSFEGRTRFIREATKAVRAAMPDSLPLWVRISHTDWVDGGWDTPEAIELCKMLKGLGVDMIDVSSGGVDARQKIPLGPGYQVPGAEAVKKGAGIAVAAVGLITEAKQAQEILTSGKADVILIARASLRDPYWPMRAAAELGRTDALKIAPQYDRGWNTLGKWEMDFPVGDTPQPSL